MIVYDVVLVNSIFRKQFLPLGCNICFTPKRHSLSGTTRTSSGKIVEEPIIKGRNTVDIIGPPDSVSNLRPIIWKELINETTLQKKLRKMQIATQEWNQHFWVEHNDRFFKERQKYIQLHLGQEKKQLTAEEMSAFYKQFLDENWETHVKYNLEWYNKNFKLLLLALQVNIEKLICKMF